MDTTAAYNYVEVGLWGVYAMILAIAAVRAAGARRRIALIASLGFAAFAVSDWIEAGTGAWWRPRWLLVLKGICIATFLACFIAWRRLSKKSVDESAP